MKIFGDDSDEHIQLEINECIFLLFVINWIEFRAMLYAQLEIKVIYFFLLPLHHFLDRIASIEQTKEISNKGCQVIDWVFIS
jgi:hypothetical protein